MNLFENLWVRRVVIHLAMLRKDSVEVKIYFIDEAALHTCSTLRGQYVDLRHLDISGQAYSRVSTHTMHFYVKKFFIHPDTSLSFVWCLRLSAWLDSETSAILGNPKWSDCLSLADVEFSVVLHHSCEGVQTSARDNQWGRGGCFLICPATPAMWSADENRGNLTRGDAISSAFEDEKKNRLSVWSFWWERRARYSL